jgi:hypothetical protein
MFVPRQQYPRELKIALMREIDSDQRKATGPFRTAPVELIGFSTWPLPN